MTEYSSWSDKKECVKANPVGRIHCILEANGTPVLIASSVNPAERKAPFVSAGEAALAAVAVPVPVLVNDRAYPLVYPREEMARENSPYTVYPAALLYAAYCQRGGACESAPEPKRVGAASPADPEWRSSYRGWSSDYERPMEVFWGVGMPDTFTGAVDTADGGVYQQDCRPADRRWGLVRAFFHQPLLRGGDRRPAALRLYAFLALSIVALASARRRGKAAFGGTGRQARADWNVDPDSNDFIEAGSHGKLPGVFYHAMALDNLIEHGSDYSAVPDPVLPPLTITDRDLQNTLAALVILFVGAFVTIYQKGQAGRAQAYRLGRLVLRAAVTTLVGTSIILLLLYMITGAVLADRFNFVALSLVALLEIFKIAWVSCRPILVQVGESNSIIRMLLGVQPGIVRAAREKGGVRCFSSCWRFFSSATTQSRR